MRIGLAEQTVISALGQAVVLSEDPPVPPKELPARLDEVSLVLDRLVRHTLGGPYLAE